ALAEGQGLHADEPVAGHARRPEALHLELGRRAAARGPVVAAQRENVTRVEDVALAVVAAFVGPEVDEAGVAHPHAPAVAIEAVALDDPVPGAPGLAV